MKWSTSDVIALIAVIGTAISPIATSLLNWLKIRSEEKQKAADKQLEIDRENYRDFSSHYRNIFENYIKLTQHDLNSEDWVGNDTFSTDQKDAENLVLMYADELVRTAILNLHKKMTGKSTYKYGREVLAIIDAFNSQWQKQLPKLH